jgi:hypothetical protein
MSSDVVEFMLYSVNHRWSVDVHHSKRLHHNGFKAMIRRRRHRQSKERHISAVIRVDISP